MWNGSEFFPRRRRTRLPGGYMGRILRVDLTSGSLKDENLPEEPVLRKLIGGQALASYILLHELAPDARPCGAESKIVMMTGPITASGFTPGGTKVTAVFLSPLTERTLGRGAASGFWPAALKAAGYDGLIVEGAASRPVYLFIDDGKAELRDAAHLWGRGTRATEAQLREEVGLKDAKVMCIGPAGENLVPAAMLVNDQNHSISHSGGAIFGSKKLKAVVVHGTARPVPADKKALVAAGQRWRAVLVQRPLAEKKTAGYGMELGAIPNNNYRSAGIADHARGFDKNRIVLKPCFACARLCPYDVVVGEGRFAGTLCHFNAGSEWLDTFFNLGIKGPDVVYLAERLNDLGIECSHFSFAAGVAFEAWEKGLLDLESTGGLAFEWGNVDTVARLLEMTARREGRWGELLAEGPVRVAEAIGGDAPRWAVHTKKGTPALHDWRTHLEAMLRELVASGGMKPQGAQGEGSVNPPPDLRYRENWGPLKRDEPAGWPRSQVVSEQFRQFCGLIGGCWFAQMHMKPDGLNCMVDTLNAITGWDFTLDEALLAGQRAVVLQSVFGTQRGWVAEEDWTNVGQRFLDPIPDGKWKGFTIAKWLPDMVYEYYRLSGREEKTGRPFPETLARLGLEELRPWSYGAK